MKRTTICLAVLVVLVATPALVSAQVLPGLPRIPSFELPSNISVGKPSFYAGWTANGWMTGLYLSSASDDLVGVTQMLWEYKTSSLYLEAAFPFDLQDYGALTLSAGGQLPGSKHPGREDWLVTGIPVTSEWSADTYWGNVGAMLVYPLFSYAGNWYALAGFQWDYWQTSFKNRNNWTSFWAWPAATDTADLTVNLYIPKIGVMNSMYGMRVGAAATPFLFGSVLFNESLTSGGGSPHLHFKDVFEPWGSWFLEAFFAYDLPTSRMVGLGDEFNLALFGKFIYVDAKKDNVDVRVGYAGGAFDQDFFDLSFRRGLFVLGAKATLNFNLAGILPF